MSNAFSDVTQTQQCFFRRFANPSMLFICATGARRRPRSQEAALQSTRCAARLGIRPQPHPAVCRAAGASGGRTLCAVGGARLGPRCCSSQQPAPARRCSSCGRAARLARRATRPTTTTTTTNDDDDDDTNTHTPRVWLGASGASPPNHRFDDGGGGFDADRLAH